MGEVQSRKKVKLMWCCTHCADRTYRIIILAEESSCFPATLELLRAEPLRQKQKYFPSCYSSISSSSFLISLNCDCRLDDHRKLFRSAIQELKQRVPVYYLVAEYDCFQPGHFFLFPNPGMVAWLQQRHFISLDSSLLVADSSSKLCGQMAIAIGLNHIKDEDLFNQNGWTVSSKMYPFILLLLLYFWCNPFRRKYTQDNSTNRPSFLQKMEFVSSSSSSLRKSREEDIPLRDHFQSLPIGSSVEERPGFGRLHGVFFPLDKEDEMHSSSSADDSSCSSSSVGAMSSPYSRRKLPEWFGMSSEYFILLLLLLWF